jgi:Domain of unknown function (DUF4279)
LDLKPTFRQKKGEWVFARDGKSKRLAKFGRWSLQLLPEQTEDATVEEAVTLLMSKCGTEPDVWRAISSRAEIRLSLGISLETPNQGMSFDPAILTWLADRAIQLDIDVYRDQ